LTGNSYNFGMTTLIPLIFTHLDAQNLNGVQNSNSRWDCVIDLN